MSRRSLVALLVAGTLLSLLFSTLPLSARSAAGDQGAGDPGADPDAGSRADSGAGSWKASGIGPQTLEMAIELGMVERPRRAQGASRARGAAPALDAPAADLPGEGAPGEGPPAHAPGNGNGNGRDGERRGTRIPTLPTVLPDGSPAVFAGLTNLQVRLPPHVAMIGFHESAARSALPLHPVGIPRNNDNMTRLLSAPVSKGPEYVVMGTRNRRPGPTSAVDLAMPFNHPVVSPVSGTVVQVGSYLLYGRVPDNTIVISPDARPDLLMVVLHTNGVRVSEGQRVVAGETMLALTARLLPFRSQIDSYAGRLPHVHIEFRRA